uniref:Uncharacterized protein n=1 Tax=Oryza sativa subsp. japonica TaxID=39947 RepID=Q6H3Y1_ORYSJ|nr:hypothetical protein [Oryza sativa Japonica Group]BAD26568.1 hypothetical protein [Oryza sativa Japonica Group]
MVVGAGLLAPPLPRINSWKDEMGARMEGVADAALLDSEDFKWFTKGDKGISTDMVKG